MTTRLPCLQRLSTCRRLSVVVLILLALPGCGKTLQTSYGTTQGQSINGVGAFVELVKKSDHRVQVWRTVSKRMKDEFDVVIMFHTQFDQAPADTIRNLKQLMRDGSIETTIIVVRDSDCSIDYWKQVAKAPDAKEADVKAAQDALRAASTDLGSDTLKEFEPGKGDCYGLKRVPRPDPPDLIKVKLRSGDDERTIDARWPLNRRLQLSSTAETLWSSGDDPLLTEDFTLPGDRILVLSSAAPILNGGLVDPGNRQLAEELVKLLPEKSRVAIALSTRWSEGKFAESPSTLQFLKVHPHGWIFGQTILALVLFCWWKLPIFGRPRAVVEGEPHRFGKHVEALGTLLMRTRDAEFARRAIRDWHRQEFGRSLPEPASPVQREIPDTSSDAATPQQPTDNTPSVEE